MLSNYRANEYSIITIFEMLLSEVIKELLLKTVTNLLFVNTRSNSQPAILSPIQLLQPCQSKYINKAEHVCSSFAAVEGLCTSGFRTHCSTAPMLVVRKDCIIPFKKIPFNKISLVSALTASPRLCGDYIARTTITFPARVSGKCHCISGSAFFSA